MAILKDIHEWREIASKSDFFYVKRKLAEATSRGWVEQIAVMKPNKFSPDEEWFRDIETGEIYRLVPPDERGGWWDKVDPADLVEPNEKIN